MLNWFKEGTQKGYENDEKTWLQGTGLNCSAVLSKMSTHF